MYGYPHITHPYIFYVMFIICSDSDSVCFSSVLSWYHVFHHDLRRCAGLHFLKPTKIERYILHRQFNLGTSDSHLMIDIQLGQWDALSAYGCLNNHGSRHVMAPLSCQEWCRLNLYIGKSCEGLRLGKCNKASGSISLVSGSRPTVCTWYLSQAKCVTRDAVHGDTVGSCPAWQRA